MKVKLSLSISTQNAILWCVFSFQLSSRISTHLSFKWTLIFYCRLLFQSLLTSSLSGAALIKRPKTIKIISLFSVKDIIGEQVRILRVLPVNKKVNKHVISKNNNLFSKFRKRIEILFKLYYYLKYLVKLYHHQMVLLSKKSCINSFYATNLFEKMAAMQYDLRCGSDQKITKK